YLTSRRPPSQLYVWVSFSGKFGTAGRLGVGLGRGVTFSTGFGASRFPAFSLCSSSGSKTTVQAVSRTTAAASPRIVLMNLFICAFTPLGQVYGEQLNTARTVGSG